MITKKITDEEISELSVSSLPTRPTAPSAFGGRGYTAAEMKAAFDRLPLLLAERFNQLLDDIRFFGNGSFLDSIPSGVRDGHTLYNLLSELVSGEAAGYIKIAGSSLAETIFSIKEDLESIKNALSLRSEGH